ncbi:glucose dehydrogenase [FAD, quinone]-like [Battus philenor]|uniref:glucose dehydrogenase [FAD, quinone]-like n=1 Tax=Battus philenor TaxID=42288 RepID=UPI0035D118D0
MFFKFLTVLLFISTNQLTNCDDEAFVETVYDEQSDSNVRVHNFDHVGNLKSQINSRSKKSYLDNSFIDAFSKITGTYSGAQTNNFFSFLLDQYNLPGGLQTPLPEYDFVIVGAGSAGSALASRLTENRNITVLLIESGKPEMILTDIPGIAPFFQSTDYVWHYYMEPQQGVCLGMWNKRCFWPRGKAVGGTSVINYMIYTRGRPEEWDRIAAAGNYGWSYADVLKYYTKLEKASLKGYEKAPHRGRDGVLPVEFVPIKTRLISAFLEAGRILGHPTVDYNAPETLGFGKVQVTMQMGRRQSAAKVYLHSHKRRPNLHIIPFTTATKVLIDPETNTAYGVEYVRDNVLRTVTVRKEVILSAGPIASPQLLMLSGVGPKDHLNSVGIPVIKDLPVGKTLYDHICFPGLIFTLNETNVSFFETQSLKLSYLIDWIRNGDGYFTTPGGVEGIGYIKTSVSDDPELVPDIELISIGGSIVSDGGPDGSKAVRKGMRITDDVFNSAFGPIDYTNTWSTFPMLLKPKSFGYLELKDKNPFSHPLLYGNYLTDPRDVKTFIAAIRHVQKLVETEPFQRFGAKIHPAVYPACRNAQFNSDEYWECALRTLTATLHHQVATCRMGPEGDPLAVVDPELRVYGVKRLRVVDTGVIPTPTSAHTNAPGMMIGEKAADLIKDFWNIHVNKMGKS